MIARVRGWFWHTIGFWNNHSISSTTGSRGFWGSVVGGGVLGVLLLAGHGRVIVVLVVAGCC